MIFTHWLFFDWLIQSDLYAYFLLDVCICLVSGSSAAPVRALPDTASPLALPGRDYSIGSKRLVVCGGRAGLAKLHLYQSLIGMHLSPIFFHYLLMQRVVTLTACLFHVQLIIAIFVSMLLWEKNCLPRVERPPVWVLAKEQTLSNPRL